METWALESIIAVISYPSTITGASLECPHQMSYRVRAEKRNGWPSGHPFFWAAFIVVSFSLGQGGECWGPTVGCCGWCWGGWATFPQFPLDGFKVFARVAHFQAMWSQPWHLKHWRELRSFLFEVPSLDPCVFGPWPPVVVVPVPHLTDVLQAEASLSQTSLAIIGAWVARSAPVHPSPPMTSLSGAIWGAGWAVAPAQPLSRQPSIWEFGSPTL